MSEVYKTNFNLFHFCVLSESKDSFSESEDFSEAESLQILQGESDTPSGSDNFQSLIFHSEASITQRQNACSNFSL